MAGDGKSSQDGKDDAVANGRRAQSELRDEDASHHHGQRDAEITDDVDGRHERATSGWRGQRGEQQVVRTLEPQSERGAEGQACNLSVNALSA